MERMATLEPLFVDVTWGAGGSTSDLTLAISANAQKYLGVEVLMHLTCTNLKVILFDFDVPLWKIVPGVGGPHAPHVYQP